MFNRWRSGFDTDVSMSRRLPVQRQGKAAARRVDGDQVPEAPEAMHESHHGDVHHLT